MLFCCLFKGNIGDQAQSVAVAWKILEFHAAPISFCNATLKYLFVETESLWSQEPVTRDFWKSCSIRPRYLIFKHFSVGSASDEIVSAYSQQSLKSCTYAQPAHSRSFEKYTKKQNKMQFMTKNNRILKNRQRSHLICPKWTSKKNLRCLATKY
jgi:hypothetical protein